MKIMIFGSSKSWAIERLYMKYLIQLGHDVSLFDASEYYTTKTIFNKFIYRYFPFILFANVNRKLISVVDWNLVDVFFVFKGIELRKRTLLKIKDSNVILANYNPDNPFIRTFASSGSNHILDCIGAYQIHFSYSKMVLEQIKIKHNCLLVDLPFAFESSYLSGDDISVHSELVRVCFVGNPDKYRVNLIKKVISWGLEIDVFGIGWDRVFTNTNSVNCCGFVDIENLYNVLKKYRVQLNIFRPHNVNVHNMRSFEICGAGGIQLAPFSEDHVNYFEENSEIFLYRDDEDLRSKIFYLLNLSYAKADEIRENARLRSIRDNYSYEYRAGIVSDCFNNYKI